MKIRFRDIYTVAVVLFFSMLLASLQSCKEEEIVGLDLDTQQLLAGRIDGTWASPSKLVLPDNLPDEIFGSMRLVFTTDDNGYPKQFYAENCPIVFSSSISNWTLVNSNQDSTSVVTLGNVTPVDSFKVSVNASYLTLSFYMGWENTDTGDAGQGNFSVTLTRQ
jgi:hypothetical protein